MRPLQWSDFGRLSMLLSTPATKIIHWKTFCCHLFGVKPYLQLTIVWFEAGFLLFWVCIPLVDALRFGLDRSSMYTQVLSVRLLLPLQVQQAVSHPQDPHVDWTGGDQLWLAVHHQHEARVHLLGGSGGSAVTHWPGITWYTQTKYSVGGTSFIPIRAAQWCMKPKCLG